ncbi:OB-fold domain-containing protein [Saccharomonospora sp. NPDC046836]|uniref:OB-fold nucleic acid binding domain-containing protein n=1 Tax=Saccharomonospora sp. NPDC046836 TaxID=3156921 RepID=UPI0034116CDB
MTSGLQTSIDEAPAYETTLTMPYTLTTGRAAGTFLAELAQHRIVGSRSAGGKVVVPAQDYIDGEEAAELVVVPGTGTVTAWTRTASGALATIRLDGADTDLVHRVLGDTGGLANGARVKAVWSSEPDQGFLTLAGFELGDAPVADAVTPLDSTAEPISMLPYRLELDYRHAYGPYYGRMFDELAAHRRIVGVKCPSCQNVLVPPRGNCDACFVPTAQVVDVADTGILKAFSVIHLEFEGQTRTPPYVYAEITLDGSGTRLIHNVGGFDIDEAGELLHIGMPVRAVWKEGVPPRGALADIDYFEPILGEG